MTTLSNAGLNSSQIGVRGSEDIAGGLKASFALEVGVYNQVAAFKSGGGLTFNTQSWLTCPATGAGPYRPRLHTAVPHHLEWLQRLLSRSRRAAEAPVTTSSKVASKPKSCSRRTIASLARRVALVRKRIATPSCRSLARALTDPGITELPMQSTPSISMRPARMVFVTGPQWRLASDEPDTCCIARFDLALTTYRHRRERVEGKFCSSPE